MAKAYRCDRCGGYYDADGVRIHYTNSTGSYTYGEFDVCPNCADEFEQWLKEKQNEKQS